MSGFITVTGSDLGHRGFFGPPAPKPVVAGRVWTTLTTGFETNANFFRTIDFINDTFVISGNGPTQLTHVVFSSTDGVTWTENSVATTSAFRSDGCGFGAGVYAYVILNATNPPRIYTSPDLATWTQRNPGFAAAVQASRPVFGNGVFLLVAIGGADYATSPDGITWTHHNTYVPHAWEIRPIFDGTQFVCPVMGTANTPKLAFSADGINWSESSATLSFNEPSPVGNDSTTQYVVGTAINDAGDSVNGAFTVSTPFSFNDGGNPTQAIIFGTTNWAHCNQNNANMLSSNNGTTWTSDTVPAAANFFADIAFGLGKFIAIGGDNSGNNYAATRPATP